MASFEMRFAWADNLLQRTEFPSPLPVVISHTSSVLILINQFAKSVYVNLFHTCCSGLLIFIIYAAIPSTEDVESTASAEGYGSCSVPTENTNATRYAGVKATDFENNQTEEIPIGIPVEKEEFDRLKDEAKNNP